MNNKNANNSFPVPEHRKEIYDFYKLAFDDQGCPAKRMDEGLVFHPILPPYLIVDYLLMYEKTGEQSWLNYAINVADTALPKADEFGDSYVFLYHPESKLSTVPKVFYSALTQSWYIKALCKLSKYVPKKYDKYIEGIFNSLLIPIDEKGVLIKKDYGWVVEEYPFEPSFYTLNGWLTVLRCIVQSSKVLDTIGIEYQDFLNNNFDAVEKLLPLYDAEFCLNSRYQLTGFSRIKLVFDKTVERECSAANIVIPNEGEFDCNLPNIDEKNRWRYYLERDEGRILQFNVILSLISYPNPNIFNATINVSKDCEVKVFLAQGEYLPNSTGMPTQGWKEISIHKLMAGENKISTDIEFDGIDMFAYPTNFKKHIGGVNYNSYHFVHIIDLGELYKYSNRNSFKQYAEKWLKYYERWTDLPCLKDGYSLTHYQYGEGFSDYVEKHFLSEK